VHHYLKGRVHHGSRYAKDGELMLYGFFDLDWVGDAGDRKSTLGSCFSLGSVVISWFNRKQGSVTLSSTEVEYMAANTARSEAIWLCKLIAELTGGMLEPSVTIRVVSEFLRI